MAAVAAVGGTNVSVGIAASAFAEAVIYPAFSMKLKYSKICLKRTPYIPETWTNGI
jgi:hypothetical protein